MKREGRALEAVLLGTAVGDALGLPAEGLGRKKIARLWPGPWKHRFFLGRGMVSDDTEHSVFVVQCLIRASGDPQEFRRLLAWKLRWWLLCFPAGVGLASLRAVLRLWLGFSPARSGVYSAGNGPAMRSAVIGAWYSHEDASLREFVRQSTLLTHTDPRAGIAALAVAVTAAETVKLAPASRPDLSRMLNLWRETGADNQEWGRIIDQMALCLEQGCSVSEFAVKMGLEKAVGGYAFHSVPVALYAWSVHYGDFRSGLESVLNCGGDTDTVAAMTGALLAPGAEIPEEWLENLRDYPLSRKYLHRLAEYSDYANYASVRRKQVPGFSWPVLAIRNLCFLGIVLSHGLRRLIPRRNNERS